MSIFTISLSHNSYGNIPGKPVPQLSISRSFSKLTGNLTVTAITTPSICGTGNGTLIATATGGTPPYTYSINTANFQVSDTFTNLGAMTYLLTVLDALGQKSSIDVNVPGIFPGPEFARSYTDPTTCSSSDGTIYLAGISGIAPFYWSFDDINYQTSGQFGNLAAGDYRIFQRDSDGCQFSYVIQVFTTCVPSFDYLQTNPDCGKSNGTLSIFHLIDMPSFSFSLNGSPFQSDSLFTNLATGIYSFSVKDGNGVVTTRGFSLYYDCPFSITTSIKDADCGKTNGSINAIVNDGNGPYQYSIDGINYTNSGIFTNLSPGTYSIRAKNPEGQINIAVATVNSCALVTAVATDEACGNRNGTITANGSGGTPTYIYSLDGTNFQTSIYFDSVSAGNYTVTIKDARGVSNTANITVKTTAPPLLMVDSTNPTCLNTDGSITGRATDLASPLAYSIDGVTFQKNSDFSGLAQGQYKLIAKDTNGCESSQTVNLLAINDLALNAGNDTSLCEGLGTKLFPTGNGATFSWSPATGLDNPKLMNPFASPSGTTKYYVTETKGICARTDSVTVNIFPAPVPDPGHDSTICYGKSTPLSGSGGISYSWSPSTYLSDPTLPDPFVNKPLQTVTYSLQVKDIYGCKSLQNSAVTITVTPQAELFAGNDTSIVTNQRLQLHAIDVNNSGFTIYSWSPPDGLSDPAIKDPIAMIGNNITYQVTASTTDGCEGSAKIRITAFARADIYVPTAFTPNGDGINDIFKPTPVGIKNFKYFIIYNRWGQQVFQSSNPENGWDGRLKGAMQTPGMYIWTTAGIDFQGNIIQRKGTVMLIR